MKEYDVLVIGNGVGGHVALKSVQEGFSTGLIDRPPVGGTCQNYGCKPSKKLIHIADRLMETETLKKDGVDLTVEEINFLEIMEDIRSTRDRWQKGQRDILRSSEGLDYHETECSFIDDHTVETEDNEVLEGDRVFIAAGARPFIPPIEGVDQVDYLTNESILELEELPESLVMIGGGYIGVEYAHFMSRMGSDVTVIQRGDRLVKSQDKDVSEYLEEKLSERMDIELHTEALRISEDDDGYVVIGGSNGEEKKFYGDEVMVAVGRRGNADTLALENTGVEWDRKGYVKVNDRLETTQENTWALGDITGRAMFKHVASLEAKIAWNNSKGDDGGSLDYGSVPNAVFTGPKIASVGLTERDAVKEHDVLVGRADYRDTIKGLLIEAEGFAKAVVEEDSRRLLGFHIIGPQAPILLQETVNAVALGECVEDVKQGIHTFPTLSRLIPAALEDLKPAESDDR